MRTLTQRGGAWGPGSGGIGVDHARPGSSSGSGGSQAGGSGAIGRSFRNGTSSGAAHDRQSAVLPVVQLREAAALGTMHRMVVRLEEHTGSGSPGRCNGVNGAAQLGSAQQHALSLWARGCLARAQHSSHDMCSLDATSLRAGDPVLAWKAAMGEVAGGWPQQLGTAGGPVDAKGVRGVGHEGTTGLDIRPPITDIVVL